jgi:hypothetical protein
MTRLEPFTSLHLDIQGGRFDHGPRLFNSVGETYRQCTTTPNDYRELIPEFYFAPEFLENRDDLELGHLDRDKIGDVLLPPWAKSPIDFVYRNRKALESDHTSAELASWIDLIWGCKQRGQNAEDANNVFMRTLYDDVWSFVDLRNPEERAGAEALLSHVGQIPAQLFDRPHPRRDQRPTVDAARVAHAVPAALPEVSSVGFLAVKSEVKILFLEANLKFGAREFEPANLVRPQAAPPKRIQSLAFLRRPAPRPSGPSPRPTAPSPTPRTLSSFHGSAREFGKPSPLFAFNRDGFCVVRPESDEVLSVHASGTVSSIKHRGRIVALSAAGDWTAVGDRESAFALYYRSELRFLIPIFTSSVRCCAVRPDFHLAVCGTRDRSLIFCSMNRGYVTRIIQLEDCDPILVAITEGWGFVCVYMRHVKEGVLKHIIVLYNVNGDVIRQTEIPSAVSAWAMFRDPDGFDHVVLGLADSSCYVFEAFYLELGDPVHWTKSPPAGIAYLGEFQILVIVTVDGSVHFVPHVV